MRGPWRVQIELGDIFHDDDIPFPEKRDEIVKRVREGCKAFTTYELEEILDSLADCEDEDDFDTYWDDLYDWADENRVWIGTI